MLREILKKIINPDLRLWFKKRKRKVKSIFFVRSKVDLLEMRKLLVKDFNIKRGDNIIITSSFGNLNSSFSPNDLINLLQEIVGGEGNIVMPYYSGNSYELAKKKIAFNMKETPSAMGVLTQVFSESENVYKSIHPTKSVVAWGHNAKEIIKNHEKSKTPYDFNSPYAWLYMNGSKSIGLGVKSLPMFHFCEDALFLNKLNLYLDSKLMKVVDYNGKIINVKTKIHNPKVIRLLMDIGDYVKRNKPKSYLRKKTGYGFSYVIDNNELYNFCKEEFHNNNFRFKK